MVFRGVSKACVLAVPPWGVWIHYS